MRKAGIEPAPRFHDLRHAGVVAAISVNAHPREIQARAGHSSIRTTMDVYGYLYDEAQVEIADKLEAFHQRGIAEAAPGGGHRAGPLGAALQSGHAGAASVRPQSRSCHSRQDP